MRTRVVKNVGEHGTFECSTNKDNLMLLLLAANSAKHGQGSEVNVRLEDKELGIVLSLCDGIQSFKGSAHTCFPRHEAATTTTCTLRYKEEVF